MTDKIKKFIECLIPISACNLKCHYCYVIQYNARENKIPELKYEPQFIAKALSKKRMGGTCLINLCGKGETLLCKNIVEIAEALLNEGHYINITTNGTITSQFEKFMKLPKGLREKLQFAFSLHYIELKNKNLLNDFINNVKMMKREGFSICVQFNMCDEYVPYLQEIKDICLENFKALPQIALTRDETSDEIKIFSKLSNEDYKKLGDEFESPLWDYTNKNFLVKRHEFCYAGDWTFRMNLYTGQMARCYFEGYTQNIYENIDKPIWTLPVGHKCKMKYCFNSSHFMSLGVMPDIKGISYSELRNRKCTDGTCWQMPKMQSFLSTKLYNNNQRLKREEKNKLELLFNKIQIKLRIKKYKKC